MNILTWTILKKTHILNGCETFAFKYIISYKLYTNYIENCDHDQLAYSEATGGISVLSRTMVIKPNLTLKQCMMCL